MGKCFCGVRVNRSLVLCVCFVDRCLAFALPVLLRYTDSDYPFGIFILFLILKMLISNIYILIIGRINEIREVEDRNIYLKNKMSNTMNILT
jgi:hypothetical protein